MLASELPQKQPAVAQVSDDSPIDKLRGYGGLAAQRVHAAVIAERERGFRSATTWGAANTHELAELLTAGGTTWQMVRRGVICTKGLRQVGPCSRKRGRPEPSQCQSSCDYRLEEAWLQAEVDGAIAEAVRLCREATDEGEELAASLWEDQILVNIDRFPQLREKWENEPVVARILSLREDS